MLSKRITCKKYQVRNRSTGRCRNKVSTRKSPKHKVSTRKSPKHKVSKRKSPKHKVSTRKSPKHKVSKRKSPKHKVSKRKSPKRKSLLKHYNNNSCRLQDSKKYKNRKSPPFPAQNVKMKV
jgi:hypothetical protein